RAKVFGFRLGRERSCLEPKALGGFRGFVRCSLVGRRLVRLQSPLVHLGDRLVLSTALRYPRLLAARQYLVEIEAWLLAGRIGATGARRVLRRIARALAC